jgi:hypothetical protein
MYALEGKPSYNFAMYFGKFIMPAVSLNNGIFSHNCLVVALLLAKSLESSEATGRSIRTK